MKSAYELAMERLEKESPSADVTDDQKTLLSKIDEKFRAKIAEKEVYLGGLLEKARAVGEFGEIAELEEQLAREVSRLREGCEDEKEKVRKG